MSGASERSRRRCRAGGLRVLAVAPAAHAPALAAQEAPGGPTNASAVAVLS